MRRGFGIQTFRHFGQDLASLENKIEGFFAQFFDLRQLRSAERSFSIVVTTDKVAHLLARWSITITETRELGYGNHLAFALIV